MELFTLAGSLAQSEDSAANFYIYVNYGGIEKWASYSPLLVYCRRGAYAAGDQNQFVRVPPGGSVFLDENGQQLFRVYDFKGLGLTRYKVGHKGQGTFINSPIPLYNNDFEWEITDVK